MIDIRDLHANHLTFWKQISIALGGAIDSIPGALLVATGINAAPFNQAHVDPDADPAVLMMAERFFEVRALPWRIISERPNPTVSLFAAERGRHQEPLYPMLSLDTADLEVETGVANPGLEIVEATGTRDLDSFIDCSAASYGHDPELLRLMVNQGMLDADNLKIYLAKVNKHCVGIGVGVSHEETIGVYFVGVRPSHRGRRIGRALTDRIIREGTAQGARTAVLQATPAGYPIYYGMGFRQVAEYHMWDFPLG